MKEPIFLEPIFKDYVWGGNKIKTLLNKNTPYEVTAESWEVSTNRNGQSTIKNEKLKNKTLEDIYKDINLRKEIFGTKAENLEEFPLLIKFIDANSNLSVQVHPDDKYANENENGNKGKTEMWYIMECKQGAKIICGMKEGTKQEQIPFILKSNKIEEYLNFIPVEKGDCIYIPSGTIHAILGNTLICEIQQNSDLTYRVYDWGRVGKDGKPRQLHIEKATNVVNTENRPNIIKTASWEEGIKNIITSKFFKVDKITVKQSMIENSNSETFCTMNVINGNGRIEIQDKVYNIKLGESFIIPANLGKYKLSGQMEILKSYI